MVDAAEAQTHDQYHRQPELLCQIGSIDGLTERDAKPTDALNHHSVSQIGHPPIAIEDRRKFDGAALQRGGNVGRGRLSEQIRRRQLLRHGDIDLCREGVAIFVVPFPVAKFRPRSDWLHARGPETGAHERTQQARCDQRLADLGVSARDEVALSGHGVPALSAKTSPNTAAVRSARRLLSSSLRM